MKLTDFKTFKSLADATGYTEKELWGVIIGDVTTDYEKAKTLSEISGIQQQTLMFSQCVRMRPGFCEWFSNAVKMTKTELWHVFQGKRPVSKANSRLLEKFTGISAEDWQTGRAWMICAKVGCGDEQN